MKKLSSRKKAILLLLLSFLLLLGFFALDQRLRITTYTIASPKVTKDLRLALITDLHSCDYGPNQKTLLDALDASNPDVLLLGGDIIDDKLPPQKAMEFLSAVSQKYPTYYVTGNHEYWTGSIQSIRSLVQSYRIPVLAGNCILLNIPGQQLALCGMDDLDEGYPQWLDQLQRCKKEIQSLPLQGSSDKDPLPYTILLSHRPERVQEYKESSFDLILTGHAHGGQWRIPFLLPGLWAPDQGFFPKYAGGKYALSPRTTLIVSRGVARESTPLPRIFNPPECVIVHLRSSSAIEKAGE